MSDRPSLVRDLARTVRPWQWVKNGVVALPLCFGRHRSDPDAIVATAFAVLAFCLLSSAVYVLNDLADRREDASHPLRRFRPIAARRIGSGVALGIAAVLVGLGFLALFALPESARSGACWLGIAYLVLQAAYSLYVKRHAVAGALSIALGFVLRAELGGVAADVVVSHWLVLCTFTGALALALGKRACDARLLEMSPSVVVRLERSTARALVLFVALYAAYTVAPRTVDEFGTFAMVLTVPIVGFAARRYLAVVKGTTRALDPARAFLADRSLALSVVAFAIVAATVVLAWSAPLP